LIKRAIDFFAALFGLIALAPLMIIVAIAVKITSPGPVFFSQMRSEKYGCSRKRVFAFFSLFPDFSVAFITDRR
jgi:lipopolysaccharide/colanic/teichoic acid biosynthesis glycosyltransferase